MRGRHVKVHGSVVDRVSSSKFQDEEIRYAQDRLKEGEGTHQRKQGTEDGTTARTNGEVNRF